MPTSPLIQKRALVIDLDGTVFLGDRPIKGSIQFLNQNAGRFALYFMTNNTSAAVLITLRS